MNREGASVRRSPQHWPKVIYAAVFVLFIAR